MFSKPILEVASLLNHFLNSFNRCVVFSTGCSAHGVSKLQEYQLEARNLKLITKKAKRDKLLKQVHNYVNIEQRTYKTQTKLYNTMYILLTVAQCIRSGPTFVT